MEATDHALLETKYEYTLLFDFYGALLKDKNYSIFEDYVCNDMSLSEIAEEQGITRQGVRDTIIRSINKLTGYEEKLGLIKRFDAAGKSVEKIKEQVKEVRELLTCDMPSDSDETVVYEINDDRERAERATEDVTENISQTRLTKKDKILQKMEMIEQMADGIIDNM